jgi:alkylation response protein AidB-like acyl-CoA dehydrogenase
MRNSGGWDGNIPLTTLQNLLLYGRKSRRRGTRAQRGGHHGMALQSRAEAVTRSTTARKMNDHYVINGNKMFITNGSIADFIVIFCLTNEDEKARTKRHSAILVETNREGFGANQLKRKMGMRASETAELHLSEVKVP